MAYYSVSPDEEANVIYLKHITITVLKHINYRENLGYITVMKHLKVVYLTQTELKALQQLQCCTMQITV